MLSNIMDSLLAITTPRRVLRQQVTARPAAAPSMVADEEASERRECPGDVCGGAPDEMCGTIVLPGAHTACYLRDCGHDAVHLREQHRGAQPRTQVA